MKKTVFLIGILVCLCLNFYSCKKQAPQLPSNKGIVKDESSASLAKINHRLAIKEDSIIKVYAEGKKVFKKNEIGFWYKISSVGKGTIIKDSVSCKFSGKLMLLNGKMLERSEKQITIGKKETIAGLEEGLKLMHKGDSATFIIPWYLGYGMIGKDKLVPPFTSIVYEIKVFN